MSTNAANPTDERTGQAIDAQGEETGDGGPLRPQGDLFEGSLSGGRLRSVLESLIFASTRPLSLGDLSKTLGRAASKDQVRQGLAQMVAEAKERAAAGTAGFVLREVAGGYHYRTIADNAFWLKRLQRTRPWRLTQATLEVLAIVAYKQPITRGEIEHLRGVDSSTIVTKLLDKRLIKAVGRKEVPGWPMQYGTSSRFLEFFGLKKLGDLPTLHEIKELTELERAEVEVPEELRAYEEERRQRIEAEQDGRIDELLTQAGAAEEEGAEGADEGPTPEAEEGGVSFEELGGATGEMNEGEGAQ